MSTGSSRRSPPGTVRVGDPVTAVLRDDAGVTVRTDGGARERFDAVVMATHADVPRPLLATPIRPRRSALGGFDYNRNEVVLHTDARVMPRRRPPGPPGTSTRPPATRRAAAVTMTYHMNRLQSLPGPVDYFVSVNPGDRVRDERVIVARTFEPPAVHVPDARRAGRHRSAPGPSPHLVCGRPPWVRVPRGRLPLGLRGGARSSARPERRGRPHEVASPRGHGRAIGGRGRSSTPCSTTSTTSRSTSTSSMRSTDACGCSAGTGRNLLTFRDADHWRPPADRPARVASSTISAREGEDPTAGGSRWSPTCASSATSSTRPASTCAATATGILRVVIVEVHNTHLRAASLHAPTRRPRSARSAPRWRRRSTCRRSSTWTARYTVHVDDAPGAPPHHASTSDRAMRPAADQPGPAPPPPDRPDRRPDARPPPVHDPQDDRADPLARAPPVAARHPRSSGTARRQPDDPPGDRPMTVAPAPTKRSGAGHRLERARTAGRARRRVADPGRDPDRRAARRQPAGLRRPRRRTCAPRSRSTTTPRPSASCSTARRAPARRTWTACGRSPDLGAPDHAGGPSTARRSR